MTGRRPPDRAYEVELDDVQSIALQAHTELPEAYYLLVRSLRNAKLGTWLASLAGRVSRGDQPAKASAINLALAHSGLREIGLDKRTLRQFGVAFQEGMSGGGGHRSWELGDVDESSPWNWGWGVQPPPDEPDRPSRPVDAVLLLFADSAATLASVIKEQREFAAACGVELYDEHGPVPIPMRGSWPHAQGVEGLREHFGFVDGISQPKFRLRADQLDATLVAPGELLLGYPNEADELPPSPTVPATAAAVNAKLAPADDGLLDLGRNGSYLVFRQIAQDVRAFWQFAAAHAAELGSIEHCAAKMIGRWRNGAPLTPEEPPPDNFNGLDEDNGFLFASKDREGLHCPVGAHVRRANPRDTLPGLAARRSLAAVQRHRIVRRGRPFGTPLAGWPNPQEMLDTPPDRRASSDHDQPFDRSRGMHFLCLNADIEQQFEFVQQRWINDPTFVNQRTDEVDPILGRQRDNPTFRVPANPTPVVLGEGTVPLKSFTHIIGGEYFFLPSQRALKYLAATATARG
jgi:Dyp-type peroxidase family